MDDLDADVTSQKLVRTVMCVCDSITCPTGGDASLSSLVSELGLGLAEGEL